MSYKINPDQQRIQDIEDLPLYAQKFIEKTKFQDGEQEKVENMVEYLIKQKITDREKLMKKVIQASRIYKVMPSRSKLLRAYRNLVLKKNITFDYDFMHLLVNKPTRSASGVLPVTVFTSPKPTWEEKHGNTTIIKTQNFSCDWNCYYCPNEPNQPRSYLLKEPGVLRANQNDFDEIKQFNARVRNLLEMGHPIDKLEILILGGTWESYPKLYREQFIRNILYAANTYFDKEPKRDPHPIELESYLQTGIFKYWENYENPKVKIIGITIETRPDTINEEMIKELRRLQVTRLQVGVQHTDNKILKKINRGCQIEDAHRAFKLLKDNCFKIDIHLMPDLPGSSPEQDLKMFDEVLHDERLQVDQWKIYPCATVPWTVIKQWYDSGKYQPYGDSEMTDVLCEIKRQVHPWIRLNRVVRDIPSEYIMAGNSNPGLRSMLPKEMEKRGYRCRCIRCREVGTNPPEEEPVLKVRKYLAQQGTEYFISYETEDEKHLFGFLRLRITDEESIFKELSGCALVRELHVYGTLLPHHDKSLKVHTQHRGYGTKLLKKAEEIALEHGRNKVAVISGVGVRKFYYDRGYELVNGNFMIKNMFNFRVVYFIFMIVWIVLIILKLPIGYRS